MTNEKPEKPKKPKPGPEAVRLKLEGDWQDNMAKAAQKKRPASGWPKPDKKKK